MRPAAAIVLLTGLLAAGCGAPPSRAPAASRPSAPAQPESNRTMAETLRRLADDADPRTNPFIAGELVEHYDRLPAPADAPGQARRALRRARALVLAGRTEAAIDALETLRQEVEARPERYGPGLARATLSELAIAHLRLGEERNCLDGHNVDSCLLPLAGGGVHRDTGPAERAMALYLELLEDRPGDLEARWLLNLAAMAAGTPAEAIPERWRIAPETFASDEATPRWYDRAPALGIDVHGLAGGSVLDDFDGDGLLDLMVSGWGLREPLRYFRNAGAGPDGHAVFVEQTREAGLEGLTGGLNLVHADYDNDGDLDVLVLRGAWLGAAGTHPNSLLRNDGPSAGGPVTFVDVTVEAGLYEEHPTQTAAWADFDGDGWLDLFVGNESTPGHLAPCRLYRNLGGAAGNGTVAFVDVASESGAAVRGLVKGVAWGDVDGDGRPDLYVSRLGEANRLLRNQGPAENGGGWWFRDVTVRAGVAEPRFSFPTFFFDYDNDGRPDLFAAGYPADIFTLGVAGVAADYLGQGAVMPPRLYRNRSEAGAARFEDVTREAGLERALYAMGSNYGDYDNDGWLDLYLGTGAPSFRALMPNRLFRNAGAEGDRVFRDLTAAAGLGQLQKGHAVSFGDVDNDGDRDIYTVLGGAYSGDAYPNALYENPGQPAGHWIALRLEGVAANRAAIGARLAFELETAGGPRTVHATVSSGGSFGASTLRVEVGLGDAEEVRRLEVRWPGSGTVQVFERVAADRFYRLREGDPAPRPVELPRLTLPRQTESSHTHRQPYTPD